MRNILCLILVLLMSPAWADEVKVEINPRKPVAGEIFQALFRVFTDSDSEPSINFSPSGVEVVGKTNQGVSTRTVYANGQLTVTREVMISYDLVANKTGMVNLRDITVQLGNKNLRHPSISINVLAEPEVQADVYVEAEVPKKELFVGEGVIVRYFLYSKVPVNNLDIKKYPKLNGFLKRFLQEPERTERVSVGGELYMRSQIYAAKLFPEKAGELKIDPLTLSATYPPTRPGDPFGAFGLSRDFKTKSINSPTVEIQVRPLPQPVPEHFSGLVGRHEFSLDFNQNKLIVNEPLEVKLTVSGGGALENLESPEIIKHPALEEFETNGDLKIADADSATKTFDYTFLPKENLQIPASKMVISYLDPSTQRYIPTELTIPEITVAGGAPATTRGEKRNQDKSEDKDDKRAPLKMPDIPQIAPPSLETVASLKNYLPYLNFALAGLAVLLTLSFLVKTDSLRKSNPVAIPTEFKKGSFSFGEFAKWMSPLIVKTGKSPSAIIKESELSDETKNYFLSLLEANEQQDYSHRKQESRFVYQAAHFKKLGHYIAEALHERT